MGLSHWTGVARPERVVLDGRYTDERDERDLLSARTERMAAFDGLCPNAAIPLS